MLFYKLYGSLTNTRDNAKETHFPQERQIKDLQSFKQALRTQYSPTELLNGYRNDNSFIASDVVVMDIDNDHSDIPEEWITAEKLEFLFPDTCFYLETSRSHNKQKKDRSPRPRYHVHFPLGRTVTDVEEYRRIKKAVADTLPEVFDAGDYRNATQQKFVSASPEVSAHEGKSILERVDLSKVQEQRPEHQKTDKPLAVQAFLDLYTMEDAIVCYLSDVYVRAGRDRYTYINGSTEGGLHIINGLAYSHHGTDPVSGEALDAFDLVCRHKYNGDKHRMIEDLKRNNPQYAQTLKDLELFDEFTLTDQEVISALKSYKGSDFRDIFEGRVDITDFDLADRTLCSMIASVTTDRDQIRRIFELSARGRGRTLKDSILEQALRETTERIDVKYLGKFPINESDTVYPLNTAGFKGRERKTFIRRKYTELKSQGLTPYELGRTLWDLNLKENYPPLSKQEFSKIKCVQDVLDLSEKPKEIKPLKVLNASDLRSAKVEPREFLVDGMFPIYGASVLAAAPKTGKSYLAVDLCLSVASGSDFLGRKTHKHEVLYIDTENDNNGLFERLEQVAGGLENLPDGFHAVVDDPEAESEIYRCGAGFEAQILQLLEIFPDIKLIVIDVYARIKPTRSAGKDIYEADYEAVKILRDLALKNDLAIIFVHHTKKGIVDFGQEAISGSTGLTGATTQNYIMRKDAKSGYVRFEGNGKAIKGFDLALEFDSDNYKWIDKGSWDDLKRLKEVEEMEKKQEAEDRAFSGNPITQKIIHLAESYPEGKTLTAESFKYLEEPENYIYELDETPIKIGLFIKANMANFDRIYGIDVQMNKTRTGKNYTIKKSLCV